MSTDYEAIRRLTIDYCWYADTQDVQGIVALFGGDYIFDATKFDIPVIEGRDSLLEFFGSLLPAHQCSQHISSNHRIDIDGTSAKGTSYYFMMGIAQGGESISAAGYYDDDYILTEHGWRISVRRGVPLLPADMGDVLRSILSGGG